MSEARGLIIAKSLALIIIVSLLVVSLCATHCAARACAESSSTNGSLYACHHQVARHRFGGIDGPRVANPCNHSELVLGLPQLEFQLASSTGSGGTVAVDSAACAVSTRVSNGLDAAPPGWNALPRPRASLELPLASPLRI